MRIYFSVFFILIQMVSAQNNSPDHYYVYEGTEIFLNQLPDQIAVFFNSEITEKDQINSLRSVLGTRFESASERLNRHSRLLKLSAELSAVELDAIREELIAKPELRLVSPVFRNSGSWVRFTVNAECIARFRQTLNRQEISQLEIKYSISFMEQIAEETYLIRALAGNGMSVANVLREDQSVVWAQPNFIYPNWEILNSSVNDPLWSWQWAHVNTGQAVASGAGDDGFPALVNGYSDADMDVDLAWDFLAENGSQAGGNASVLVAMLDSGVDLDHPDIQDNLYSLGKDFTDDNQTDAEDTHGHGTCTAGIVAGVANNGQGIAGIAYNSKILPLRIMNTWGVTQTSNLVQAIDYAWQEGADILSNSWGGTTPEQALNEAINRAKTQGRSGLGCVILFSSGNEGRGHVNYPAYLDDVIGVGASNMFDEKKNSGSRDYNRKWSNNYGATLDLVAPTIVYAPDIQGTDGYTEGDYFEYFGGTSAACPNAAGVAALVLASNSGLTSAAVQDVLQKTAAKIELYAYDANSWNKHVGFGRVNALGAVRMAQNLDGAVPLLNHQTPLSGRSTENRIISAEISDASGLASGASEPQLFYRAIFNSDSGAWNSVSDVDGPLGNVFEFVLPGQKWGTQVQYYFSVQDLSAQGNKQTYPFGGNESSSAPRPWMYHVGDLSAITYHQSNPVSWDNNWKDYKTSTLNVSDNHEIVDLNVTVDYSGSLSEAGIDLSAGDDLGAGLAMHYEGSALSNTEFDDEAGVAISDGLDPFSGVYQADNGLFNFDGKSTAGLWKIGVYDGDYTGSNSGSINSWSLDVTYMLPNETPVVSDIPNQTIFEGESFIQIQLDDYVSDADHPDDSLSWTYTGNQDLTVSIDANRQATITTPDENWYGAETITFTVSDPGAHTDSDAVLFTVTGVNDPPVVTNIPDQTIDEGQTFSLIPLDNYVSDIDHADAEILWTVSGNIELSVTIDQNRNATIIIPDINWNGDETLRFKATDPGALADSTEAIFTVIAINDAPVITSEPPTETFEDSLYEYQVEAIDVDTGDVLVYHLLQAPVFLGIDTLSGYISGTPANEDVGLYDISIQVSDQVGAWDRQNYQLNVINVNDPPQVIEIPAQTIDEGQTFSSISLDDYVSDPDHADADMIWTTSGNQDLITQIDVNRIATITTPDTNWNGQEQITFVATDPDGLADSSNVLFTVNAINDTPFITSEPLLNATQDQLYRYQVTATDVDSGDALRYQLLTAPPFLAMDSLSGLISGIPLNEHVGQHTVYLQVTDQADATDTQEYMLTVDNLNDPPVVSDIPDQTIDEGQTFSSISLDDYVFDPDHSDADMIWTASGNRQLIVQIDANRMATITIPDTNWNGQEQITFTATDPIGLSDSSAVGFTVLAVNDDPVITSEPLTNATQDKLYQYQLTATDSDNGDVLIFQLLSAPSFLTIDSLSGLVSGVPLNADVGEHVVSLQVKDQAGATDPQEYILTVDNENDPPCISGPLPVIHFAEDDSVYVPFETWYPFVEDIDDPDESLEYRVQNNQQNLGADLLQNGYWFNAETDWFGSDSLQLLVSDGNAADSAAFLVRVDPRNDPPQIVNLPDSLLLLDSASDTLFMWEHQQDIDSADSLLQWSFEASDSALIKEYNPLNRKLVLSAPGLIGTVQLYMTLSDDSAATTSDSLQIVVKQETGIDEQSTILPSDLVLKQNFPNPFNPDTKIEYSVGAIYKSPVRVQLTVYNALGQKVRTLVSKRQQAGHYQIQFNAQGLSSGVYLYVLRLKGDYISRQIIRKMLYMK